MKRYDTTQFEKDLREFHIVLEQDQIDQFLLYYELLTEWNSFMNLTSIVQYDEVMKKHFTDSISIVKAYTQKEEEIPFIEKEMTLIDVGTGAGFPGIPLKIVFPRLKVTLLDSLNKRVKFLNELIKELKLTGIEAVHGRAEDFAKPGKLRESYDLCVSRAVANLSTLSEYCIPFVKIGGQFIAYKSEKSTEEIEQAEKAIKLFGGKVKTQVEFMLPDSGIYRNLIVIDKVNKTSEKFPRKAGLPAKEPIISC